MKKFLRIRSDLNNAVKAQRILITILYIDLQHLLRVRDRVAVALLLAHGLRSVVRPRQRVDHLGALSDAAVDVHSQAEDRY